MKRNLENREPLMDDRRTESRNGFIKIMRISVYKKRTKLMPD